MKLPGLVVAILVVSLVPAAHAQEKVKESKSVKLADVVGRWAGTWPNVDVYTNSSTPTRGHPDTITIRPDSTWTTGGSCDMGTLCARKPRVIGDTLSLDLSPEVGRLGYVVTLKDQQLILTNITSKTDDFIGKRIDVPNSKP